MKYLTLTIALLGYVSANLLSSYPHFFIKSSADDDANKSLKEIVKENGFAIEQHTVTTADGYILTLFRVPGFLNETIQDPIKKPVVLLQHGLEADADCWVINSPDVTHTFVLARQGFDVWMGNNRGNKYSLAHKTLDPNDPVDKPKFWQFSFEQMGIYDLPAEIDYILEVTGQEKLSYVGHSEGTTQMFIGASLNQEYFKSKVNVFLALAPITRIGHVRTTLLKLLADNVDAVQHLIIDDFGMYDMFGPDWLRDQVTAAFCDTKLGSLICDAFLEMIGDMDVSVDNLSRVKTYLTHVPSGSGYRDFVHYAQIINTDRFQRYDFGADINLDKYNSTIPPLYPIDQIKDFPIALFGGTLDELGSVTDVDWTNQQLGNNVVFYGQYELGHMSFLIAKDMTFFTVDAVNVIKKYSTNSFVQQGFLQE